MFSLSSTMTDKQKGENGNTYSWDFSGRTEHVAVYMDVFRELWPPPCLVSVYPSFLSVPY